MFYVSSFYKKKVKEFAERLGVSIPHDIDLFFWSLPILEVIVDRLELLEQRLREIEGGRDEED